MSHPLSIVIPFYKINFFEETLKSLADQTNKKFNLYIGDDASPEDPRPLIKKYEQTLNLQYHKFDHNLGKNSLIKQWDRCLKMIGDEEWIMILGDDDVLESNVVSSFYKKLTEFKEKSNVVRFASKILDNRGDVTSQLFKQPTWEDPATAFYRRFKGHTRSTLSEYIFQKRSYLKYGFRDFPLAWHSDDCAWLEFSEEKPIYGINESAVLVRLSEHNISGRKDNLHEKWLAETGFYQYIISHKISDFNMVQRKFLLEAFENTIRKKRKVNFKEWILLLKQYLYYTDIQIQKKFIKRKLKSIFGQWAI